MDGLGGVFVVWMDNRMGDANHDIYLQHLTGSGTIVEGWPPNGLAVCTSPSDDLFPRVISDGVQGVYVAWQSGVSAGIFAERITAAGAIATGWVPQGTAVCDTSGTHQ